MSRPKLVKCTRSSTNGKFVKGQTYPVTDIIGLAWNAPQRKVLNYALFTTFNADYKSKVIEMLQLNVLYKFEDYIFFTGRLISEIKFINNYNSFIFEGKEVACESVSLQYWEKIYSNVILGAARDAHLEQMKQFKEIEQMYHQAECREINPRPSVDFISSIVTLK